MLLPPGPDTVRRSCRAGPGLDKAITTSNIPYMLKEESRKIKPESPEQATVGLYRRRFRDYNERTLMRTDQEWSLKKNHRQR